MESTKSFVRGFLAQFCMNWINCNDFVMMWNISNTFCTAVHVEECKKTTVSCLHLNNWFVLPLGDSYWTETIIVWHLVRPLKCSFGAVGLGRLGWHEREWYGAGRWPPPLPHYPLLALQPGRTPPGSQRSPGIPLPHNCPLSRLLSSNRPPLTI